MVFFYCCKINNNYFRETQDFFVDFKIFQLCRFHLYFSNTRRCFRNKRFGFFISYNKYFGFKMLNIFIPEMMFFGFVLCFGTNYRTRGYSQSRIGSYRVGIPSIKNKNKMLKKYFKTLSTYTNVTN